VGGAELAGQRFLVGNGVDGDTPGATHNGNNDAAGTSPGNPGAKGKKS